MLKSWRTIEGHEGRYQISNEGTIRTASKKLKKLIKDTRGRDMVVLDDVAYYVSDLHAEAFGTGVDPDNFNERALEAAISSKSTRRKKSDKYIIREIVFEDELGRETYNDFSSFSAAAKMYGYNYDKFYNAFYTGKKDSIVFEGRKFTLIKM